MDYCKHSNIFGEPEKGLHSYRVLNIAIIDVLVTIIISYIIHYYTKVSFAYILLFLFILSIILHKIFCVKTTVNKFLSTS